MIVLIAGPMDIEAVTFDAGGTLIAPWPSVGRIYAQGAASLGLGRIDADELDRRFERVWNGKTRFDYTKGAWFRIVAGTFSGLVAEPALGRLAEHLYDLFRGPEVWRVQADVQPTLDVLRSRGLRLGIISNWDDRLLPLLSALGLAEAFDTLVVSCETNWFKPDARLFLLAAERLGVSPGSILHVGDHASEDCEGARGAGFKALRLDRASQSTREVITSLKDVLDLAS